MYGPALTNKIPEQNAELVLLMAERFQRSVAGHERWATKAKECVDFVEGRQWSMKALKQMEDIDRPALTINKIRPLIRMILGYHRNNRTDHKFLPGNDGTGTEETAKALTHIAKQISEQTQEPYIAAEVFMDGIITGRGYYDVRLKFDENQLGEVDITAKDPFGLYIDSDGDSYDLNKTSTSIFDARWVSVEEIDFTYGAEASALVQPLVYRSGYAGMPSSVYPGMEEITPWRTFGGGYDQTANPYAAIEAYLSNAYDETRKNIRLIDCQHYRRVKARVFEDLETGSQSEVPEHWGEKQITKMMAWIEEQFYRKGEANSVRLVNRVRKRVRWTTMVGDIIVYDDWSPYDTFTVIPFFPYFRRGETSGAVDDLIDPQKEVNKRASSEIDIITRSTYNGWMYHVEGLKSSEKSKLQERGAAPGINIEWQGDKGPPEQIKPPIAPMAMDRLETKRSDNIKEISGINDSMGGFNEKVQSGRALEARTRQGVMSIQTYMDNNSRTRELVGRKKLELIQKHYTEARTARILGEDGSMVAMSINERDPVTSRIRNDVTLGKYSVTIDETPLSKSFLSAQFEELVELIEKGILPAELMGDIAVDVSSLPRKDEIKQRLKQYMATQGIPVGEGGQPQQALPQPQQQQQSLVQDGQGRPVGVGGRVIQQ